MSDLRRRADWLLDTGRDMQAQRDRAIVQRASFESHLWHAETLLKQVATLLPRLLSTTPADGVARDTLCDQINEFLSEPRHHPELPGGGADLHGEGSEALPPGSGGDDA